MENVSSRRSMNTGSASSLLMDTCKLIPLWLHYAFLLASLGAVLVNGQGSLRISFTEMPLSISSSRNTTFRFDVMDKNGFNPCTDQQCSFRCKLDQSAFQDCHGGQASFQNLPDGEHVFSALAQVLNGSHASSEFSWIVDTIPPTAVLDGGRSYSNEMNATVNISFSEKCENLGGFVCTNISSCELRVFGEGTVIPYTLKEIERGRVYTLVVEFSRDVPRGRVVVALARSACADAAGNLFKRKENSSLVIHYDRTAPIVNLWTAVPDFDIAIGSEHRTIQVTNKASNLRVYLDFNEPITTTAEGLLGLLNVSSGVLTATHRRTASNRRFGYLLSNVGKVSVVTITLPGNVVATRYGTLVPSISSTTFLYDMERPEVRLITSSPAKTKNHIVPIEVLFTEAVFGFNSSGVLVSGGALTSFREVSKNTYALEVYAVDDNVVSAVVPESQCVDVAGNSNLASSILQVRHYTTPAVSVGLCYLTTAGLLSTAFVSGVLTVSSTILAAVGALSNGEPGSIRNDPSRNFLGMACHLQIFALSDWLSVSLPIEYREVTNGLQWLIPHLRTPWQDNQNLSNAGFEIEHEVMTSIPRIIRNSFGRKRRLLATGTSYGSTLVHRGRMLGTNTTMYGPAFQHQDYELYFLNPWPGMSSMKKRKYSGWQDFERNIFWICVVGGSFCLLHILVLQFLRRRLKSSLRGALIFPRPELFFLVLVMPGLCQASAFIIRGGTTVGIAIGVLLLSIPGVFLLCLIILVVHGVCFRALVQYKEFRPRDHSNVSSQIQTNRGLVTYLTGTGFPGMWVRRSRLALTFLPRYGLFFEDRKGPPRIIAVEIAHKYNNNNSTRDGIGNIVDSVDTDENDSDEVEASCFNQAVGCARAAYILLDLSRRIVLGVLFGAYPRSDQSWSQTGLVFGIHLVQLLYLVLVKPYRKRSVQLVETISLLCEVGVFSMALALLAKGDPTENHFAIGILMIAFLLISFVAELVNEWYAIMKQLLHLSTIQEPSLKEGLKMLAGGIIIPFMPRFTWSRFINFPPPPPTGTAPQLSSSRSIKGENAPRGTLERHIQDSTAHLGSPLEIATTPGAFISLYHPESPAFIDPRSYRGKSRDGDSGPPSGELRQEEAQKTWSSKRAIEGKKSKGSSKDNKTEELRMLRELAKASFSRRTRDDDCGAEQGVGTYREGMGTPVGAFSPAESPQRRGQKRYARRRREFQGVPQKSMVGYTDDSVSEATSEVDTLHEDPPSLPDPNTLADSAAPFVASSSTSNKGSGHGESLPSNLPFRELGIAIRPLEER